MEKRLEMDKGAKRGFKAKEGVRGEMDDKEQHAKNLEEAGGCEQAEEAGR